jgi:hypothetical protein
MFLSAQRNLSALNLPVRLFTANSRFRRAVAACAKRQQKG